MKIEINQDFIKILLLYLVWLFFLIFLSLTTVNYLPLASYDKFLGGTPRYHFISPAIFSFANFDGEHYLSIAIFGYKHLEQAFFPIYPKLIYLIAHPFYKNIFSSLLSSTLVGILISNICFLISLVLLWKLILIDYNKRTAYIALITICVFPTSFYFGAVYSESLFLLLIIASFYSARKKRWFLASIFGAIASATRVFGILLLPALMIEALEQRKHFKKLNILWLTLVPVGLLSYMFYQFKTVNDPLAFYNLQTIVGQQHQAGVVLLPQIFFRYFKIVFSTSTSNPIFQTILLELANGTVFFVLHIYGFLKKIRLSYLIFSFLAFILPTIQGSFSSMPRYVLILFPCFMVIAMVIDKLPKFAAYILLSSMISLLAFETTLFFRGYWVA